MSFSATRNILPGSPSNPDIATLMFASSTAWHGNTKMHRLNYLGNIPVVSTFTGLGRALLALAHMIIHCVAAIFSKMRDHHFKEIALGAWNFGIALIEILPIIGNIIMVIINLRRIVLCERFAQSHQNMSTANQAVLYAYGQEIARKPIVLDDNLKEQLNNLNTTTEMLKYM